MTALTRETYDQRRRVLQRNLADAESAYSAAARAAAVGDGTDAALEEADGKRGRAQAKLSAYDTAWAEQQRIDAKAADEALHERWRASEAALAELLETAEAEMGDEIASLVQRVSAVVERLGDTWTRASRIIDKHRVPKGGSYEALRQFNMSGAERAEAGRAALTALRELGQVPGSLALDARLALNSVKPADGLG